MRLTEPPRKRNRVHTPRKNWTKRKSKRSDLAVEASTEAAPIEFNVLAGIHEMDVDVADPPAPTPAPVPTDALHATLVCDEKIDNVPPSGSFTLKTVRRVLFPELEPTRSTLFPIKPVHGRPLKSLVFKPWRKPAPPRPSEAGARLQSIAEAGEETETAPPPEDAMVQTVLTDTFPAVKPTGATQSRSDKTCVD